MAHKLARKKPADLKLLHQTLFGRKGKVIKDVTFDCFFNVTFGFLRSLLVIIRVLLLFYAATAGAGMRMFSCLYGCSGADGCLS